MNKPALAEDVRERRTALGLTVTQVAAAAGSSVMTVYAAEAGRRPGRITTAERIAVVLGWSLSEFLSAVERARRVRG